MCFPTNCDQCHAPAETRMKITSIPHFKEVVIMATTCDVCGARTNEVKVIFAFLYWFSPSSAFILAKLLTLLCFSPS